MTFPNHNFSFIKTSISDISKISSIDFKGGNPPNICFWLHKLDFVDFRIKLTGAWNHLIPIIERQLGYSSQIVSKLFTQKFFLCQKHLMLLIEDMNLFVKHSICLLINSWNHNRLECTSHSYWVSNCVSNTTIYNLLQRYLISIMYIIQAPSS